MYKYSGEHKLFIYDNFAEFISWRKCHRKFGKKYLDSAMPCKATAYNVITKLNYMLSAG
jgi:hypothetical protein